MKVNFTKLQAEEIAHKLCIVRDEDDLLDSYELDRTTAERGAEAFLSNQGGGLINFDAALADCIVGELDNSVEIALANLDAGAGPEEQAELRGYISSMRAAQRKLNKAI